MKPSSTSNGTFFIFALTWLETILGRWKVIKNKDYFEKRRGWCSLKLIQTMQNQILLFLLYSNSHLTSFLSCYESWFSIQWVRISTLPATGFYECLTTLLNCSTETKTFFRSSCVTFNKHLQLFFLALAVVNAPAWRHSPWIHSLISLERIDKRLLSSSWRRLYGTPGNILVSERDWWVFGPRGENKAENFILKLGLKFLNCVIKTVRYLST